MAGEGCQCGGGGSECGEPPAVLSGPLRHEAQGVL